MRCLPAAGGAAARACAHPPPPFPQQPHLVAHMVLGPLLGVKGAQLLGAGPPPAGAVMRGRPCSSSLEVRGAGS